MANFEIVYRDGPKAPVMREDAKGHSEALLRRDFESRGCTVLAILPKNENGLKARLRQLLLGRLSFSVRFGVSTGELALLCEVLKALYSSGVPMLQSLQIIIDETPNPWMRKRIAIVLECLRDGADIYTAMSDPRCRRAFPVLMRETIRTGEVNGRLELSLERLAETYQRASETRRETISALLYPAVAFMVFAVVCTVITLLVPAALEDAVGIEQIGKLKPRLPTVIRVLFFLRDSPAYLAMPPVFIGGIAFLWTLGKRHRSTRTALTRVERRVPVIGAILYQFSLVRFLDLLAANNETGIQLAESLNLIRGTVQDALIENSLVRIRERILTAGASLAEAMNADEEHDTYPGLVRQMVRAGEESGQLTKMLLPIAEYYGGQAKASLKRMLDLLTPIMIVLLGAVIGPVLLGVYKTMYLLQELSAFGLQN